jgi:hypothetical protein
MKENATKSYRLTALTLRQIDALTEATGHSKANVIATAIDRMYREEIKTMNSSTYTIRQTQENGQRVWYVAYNGQDWGRYERGTDAWNAANQMATKNAELSGGTLAESPGKNDTWIINYPPLKNPSYE